MDSNTIVFPQDAFLGEYRLLRRQGPGAGVSLGAGLICHGRGVSLLAAPRPSSAAGPRRRLWMQLAPDLARVSPRSLEPGLAGGLFLGQARELGQAIGWVQMEPGQFERVAELHLPGPGMERVRLLHPVEAIEADDGVWSRAQGALGTEAWGRFSSLRFAVVGVGRLGSRLASLLVRDGARELTLIDPDQVEPHNIGGGSGAILTDAGRLKVDVLAELLNAVHPAIEVEALPVSVTHLRAFDALAQTDFIVSTPDHDSARLGAAWLAAMFHKPLVDVGTGILRDGVRREMGADIRLVWPGRCLVCAGGLRDAGSAQQLLASAEAEWNHRQNPSDWRRERAGSLASLNAIAAGVAVRAIQDFVEGRLTQNGFWLRLQYDGQGRLAVTYPQPGAPAESGCCCALAGLGEDGLDAVPALVRNVRSTAVER